MPIWHSRTYTVYILRQIKLITCLAVNEPTGRRTALDQSALLSFEYLCLIVRFVSYLANSKINVSTCELFLSSLLPGSV